MIEVLDWFFIVAIVFIVFTLVILGLLWVFSVMIGKYFELEDFKDEEFEP